MLNDNKAINCINNIGYLTGSDRMSGGFYFLNEFDTDKQEEKKATKDAYTKSDISYSGSYAIYIKSVRHMIDKIESIVDIITRINDPKVQGKAQLKTKLALDIDNVKKILAEFIKALSSTHDAESKDIVTKLRHDFMVMDTMVDLLFVIKDTKYGYDAIKIAQVLLQVLSHLSEQVVDVSNNSDEK